MRRVMVRKKGRGRGKKTMPKATAPRRATKSKQERAAEVAETTIRVINSNTGSKGDLGFQPRMRGRGPTMYNEDGPDPRGAAACAAAEDYDSDATEIYAGEPHRPTTPEILAKQPGQNICGTPSGQA